MSLPWAFLLKPGAKRIIMPSVRIDKQRAINGDFGFHRNTLLWALTGDKLSVRNLRELGFTACAIFFLLYEVVPVEHLRVMVARSICGNTTQTKTFFDYISTCFEAGWTRAQIVNDEYYRTTRNSIPRIFRECLDWIEGGEETAEALHDVIVAGRLEGLEKGNLGRQLHLWERTFP